MRTQEEILARYEATRRSDFLGFRSEVLLPRLDFAHARKFLKPDADANEWDKYCGPTSEDAIKSEMSEYMSFAWQKVLDHRGISASRSVGKMIEWLWLLGDDELVAFAEDGRNHAQYGAPILKAICEKYGVSIPDGEDAARMARGEPCEPGCDMGCGR